MMITEVVMILSLTIIILKFCFPVVCPCLSTKFIPNKLFVIQSQSLLSALQWFVLFRHSHFQYQSQYFSRCENLLLHFHHNNIFINFSLISVVLGYPPST